MTAGGVVLRAGVPLDAASLTELHLRAIRVAMPWLVSPHDEAATLRWMEHVVLKNQRVWVAEVSKQLVGFAALEAGWLEQLYVEPTAQRAGVGRALLEAVKATSPGGLRLYVFTRNAPAPNSIVPASLDATADRSRSRRSGDALPGLIGQQLACTRLRASNRIS